MSRPQASSDAAAKETQRVDVAAIANKLVANIEKVILGKRQQITLALVAYLLILSAHFLPGRIDEHLGTFISPGDSSAESERH